MSKKFLLLLLMAMGFWPLMGMAYASITLDAPDKAARESAFVATAISDQPVSSVRFEWNGKTHDIKTGQDGDRWIAKILLPVPPDEKAASKTLAVTADGKLMDRREVKIYSVKRPVQKLQVDKKYVEPPKEVQARIRADREKVRQALARNMPGRMWEAPFLRPVQGGITSQYGLTRVFNGQPRGRHRGLDLRAAEGTPIQACADGVVALVDNLYYSGNTVYINHGDGVFSAYLHMSKPLVREGERVSRGDVVGLAGATGRVTGPHLHLSMYSQGQSVDPLPLLEQPRPNGDINVKR